MALTLTALNGECGSGPLFELVGKMSAMNKTDAGQFAMVGGEAERVEAEFAGLAGD